MKRKSPIRHEVSGYYRQGKFVESFTRGSGQNRQRSSRSKVVGGRDVRGPMEIHNYDDLLKEWLEESGADFVDFDDPIYRLIDSGWFEPKRSFDEFVREKIGREELGNGEI